MKWKEQQNEAARSAGHGHTVLQMFVHINTLKSWKPVTFTQKLGTVSCRVLLPITIKIIAAGA
ncbi:MAG: hypothetical protein EON49_03670 [Acidovorax sp.]|nr:MAG: hypothetical protein EON49_03670 [Acidovorax sp.]